MNDKIRNTLLIVCVVIVLLIFVDLIFNFTGIMVEKFDSSDSVSIENKNIKSIISKQDGRIFNVAFNFNDTENKTISIASPTDSNANIYYDSNGTLGDQAKNSASELQQFMLHFVADEDEYLQIINREDGNELGGNTSCVKYPFYVIIPKNDYSNKNKRCLSYEPGRLFLANAGNYTNQHWDVSKHVNLNTDSLATHDVNNSSYGSLNTTGSKTGSGGELFDPNKIKINLNLTDELKSQLFGNNIVSSSGSSGSGKCGTQVNRDAVSSLCRGCNPDRL